MPPPSTVPLPTSSLTGVTLTATSGTSTTVIGTQTIPLSSLSLGANTVQITPGSNILTALQSGATVTPSLNLEYANGLQVVSTTGTSYPPRVQDNPDELSWIPAPAPALTPTVVYNVFNDSFVGFDYSSIQYTNDVGVSFMYYIENGNNIGTTTISLSTNSNANNVQWSMSNNQYMSITSNGGTVTITGSGFNSGGTQALHFTIPQTTFNNVTYAAFSGSINVTANNTGSERISPALTPTVVYNVIAGTKPYVNTFQYTNGVGVSFMYYIENGNNIGSTTIGLSTNSNPNNVQWSMSNNQYMTITSSGGTVSITGSGFNSGGTQALYFTIPQTTFNNVTYAAFSGSINVTAELSSSPPPPPPPPLTPTVVNNVIVGTEPDVNTYQYTNGVGITYWYTLGAGTPFQPTATPVPLTLTTNSNINNVQWSIANNNYMSITSSGGTVNMIGGGSLGMSGTQALYFTIPQTTFNNVTYAAFSGSINVTSVYEIYE
jgi:hypothetical protein